VTGDGSASRTAAGTALLKGGVVRRNWINLLLTFNSTVRSGPQEEKKMVLKKISKLSLLAVLCLVFAASSAYSQNLLSNPGFETGPTVGVPPTGWQSFGNAYQEPASTMDNRFVPLSGNNLCSMYGNFWGSFNVSGIFQEFPAAPGDEFTISSNARYWEGDAMIGSQATGGNWVVQKIAFFDEGGNEIGSAESIILDGSFSAEDWHPADPVSGTAPDNTVKVQALILYLQPLYDGGAANIDDVVFTQTVIASEESSWGAIKSMLISE
jgi:hypothetical protein